MKGCITEDNYYLGKAMACLMNALPGRKKCLKPFYLFFVCPTKTLNLTFRVELLAHHHSEHINNNDLTTCKSCTGLKNGICITQKLSHLYPHEGALGGV